MSFAQRQYDDYIIATFYDGSILVYKVYGRPFWP